MSLKSKILVVFVTLSSPSAFAITWVNGASGAESVAMQCQSALNRLTRQQQLQQLYQQDAEAAAEREARRRNRAGETFPSQDSYPRGYYDTQLPENGPTFLPQSETFP